MYDSRWVHEIDIGPHRVDIFYTNTPRGILLDCLAYVHPAVEGRGRGHQEELEDLMPDWNERQDLRVRLARMASNEGLEYE